MRHKTVSLDPLDVSSIIRAQRELYSEAERFEEKVEEFVQRLAEIGRSAAQGAYGGAISVTIEQTGDGVAIIASGDAVVFLEFGAGSRVDTGNRFVKDMPFEVSSGSWSRSPEGSGEFERTGRWEFPPGSGVYMEYIAPRNGMEKAYEAMVRDVETLARAVFV